MNTLHKGITILLRSAITGEKLSLPEDFSLEAADELIRSQSLLPMIYLGAYNCGIPANTEQMLRYKQQYFRILMRHEQQMREVKRLCRTFEENGIDYALLKGCIMKPLYPNPEMRVMGDADILIRKEQYDRIRGVMTGLGFREDVESAYDVHWISKDLLAELHHRIYAQGQTDIAGYFEDAWGKMERKSEFGFSFSPEDHYLHIFTHMTKHFRHCGIGARQIVDIQVYRMAHPEMNAGKIESALKQMNLIDFHDTILQLLEVWFGGAEDTPLSDAVTAYVFSGGNWGNIETKMYTEALIHASGRTRQARGVTIFRTIFPKLAYMQGSYSILFRLPWLLPLFWIVRWVEVLLFRRKKLRKRLSVINNMSDKSVTEHKTFLDAVGLTFYEK